jgi:hypothetical protein
MEQRESQPTRQTGANERYFELAVAVGVVILIVAPMAGWGALSRFAEHRARAVLRNAYGGHLQVNGLRVRLFPGVHIEADGIVLQQRDRLGVPAFLTARHLSADAGFLGALRSPVRIKSARLEGLEIHMASRRQEGTSDPPNSTAHAEIAGFTIDRLNADGTSLEILPLKPDKKPLEFEIRELRISNAGTVDAMTFEMVLRNAKPPGDIHSKGHFGPLRLDDPATSDVSGSYTFDRADLSVFKGIAGISSSEGQYRGTLDRIQVDGNTQIPDFRTLISGNRVNLTTQFHAVVDGTNGDTMLTQIDAKLGQTHLLVNGSVKGTKGIPGRTISLAVTINSGRVQDLITLGVKGLAPISGAVVAHSTILIPPGPLEIPQKIHLEGDFKAAEAHFRKMKVQDRIDKLSDRGRGEPNSDDEDVASDFQGRFSLNAGVMSFDSLAFQVSGVRVALTGNYDLAKQAIDLKGSAALQAKVSQTVTGVKSFLLKAVDPLFSKAAKGAVLPIKLAGELSSPSIELDTSRILRK